MVWYAPVLLIRAAGREVVCLVPLERAGEEVELLPL
jgi:hypothetical protein